ncbi:type II toxin-antitoxin system VapC family toxin [Microbacterium panaciterrae]|uniref:PIN domain-containing protein n=1 Tax=Microbacterium panaciterrae TaxID=985759 RepID=A0ABP8P1I6_9MICO
MNRLGLTDGLVGIDTNVILRYLIRDDEAQFAAAAEVLEACTPDKPGFLTAVNLAEIYWVLQRSYRLSREASLSMIRRLLEVETLEFDDSEGIVQAVELAENGADFADALIHATYLQFGVSEAVTFDRAAARRLGWRLLEG